MRVLVTGICRAMPNLASSSEASDRDDAAPGVEHRLFGRQDHIQSSLHLPGIGVVGGIVALDLDGFGEFGDDAGLDHILGQVDQHRTGPSRRAMWKASWMVWASWLMSFTR